MLTTLFLLPVPPAPSLSVYQWGDIGIGRRFSDRKKKSKLTPQRVVFKKVGSTLAPKIVKIFAGGHSSYALDTNGVAWFWGSQNNNNQHTIPTTIQTSRARASGIIKSDSGPGY